MRPGPVIASAILVLLALAVSGYCAGNRVFNGDFETVSTENPPPGWTMWGDEKWKVPANYTRDTTNPHRGAASLRIQRPAGTDGYIVSAPEHALRPRRGLAYTISFWARSDAPGAARFGVTAYSSVQPFIDAPSPGDFPLATDVQWREFHFTIYEGWDFFADESRYLLLTFTAPGEREADHTLWIDDVVVAEQPSPRQGRLLSDRELRYEPLAHRLRPGATLDLTVDVRRPLRRATHDVGGISFHRVSGWTGQPYDEQGNYTLAPQLEQAIRDLHLPMTRFYAVGDERYSLEEAIDKAADMCRRIGVPLDHVALEFETQGATSMLSPEVWARGVRYSVSKGYGFRYWEIGNEPSVAREGAAFPSPESYIAHFLAVSRAIRAVQPEAQIGLPIDSGSWAWGNALLKECAGHYDFVVGHYYSWISHLYDRKFEIPALAANYQTLDRILRVNALLRAYNPGRHVYQYDTEWGMICSGPNDEVADDVDRNANIVGTVHRAVRLIYYAREDLLRGASSWQMLNTTHDQGFGILAQSAPDQRFMLYWLYYYFNRHLGEWALDMQGTAPFYTPAAADGLSDRPADLAGPMTPALVTLSKDGKSVYLVIANGSWETTVPCAVDLRHFRPARAAGALLTNSDLDAKPLLARKEDLVGDLPVAVAGTKLTCTLPPHSVVFVTVQGERE